MVRRLAGLEINALTFAKVLPAEVLKGARVANAGTPIHDISGKILFYRVPVTRKGKTVAFADVAANPIFGSPLIAFHLGLQWSPEELMKKAEAAAREKTRGFKYDRARFVDFSHPKIAVQFTSAGKEVAMIELHSWEQVPPFAEKPKDPYNSRWSLIKAIPADVKENRTKLYVDRVKNWDTLLKPEAKVQLIDPDKLGVKWPIVHHEERIIHYSTDDATHVPCFELVPQHTSVWCVAASTKMILDFYRFVYTQDRIAAEEGLGTHTAPNGLPYGEEHKVVDTIEKLSRNGLDATLDTTPSWVEFKNEIKGNRPLISFIPGHSRAVAGYSQTSTFPWLLSRYLRVYDPWPPHVGVITWENFDAQTYRVTFTIKPKTV